MKLTKHMRAAATVAVLALAIPASAAAHPGVYTVTQKIAPAGVTFTTNPSGSLLTDRTQYAIANDGYPLGLTEDNGLTSGGGMINYKALPGTYRAPMTSEEKRTYPGAQTNAQAHATCSGVAALTSGPNILAWQGADPFYNYIPWQKTSAGLGDDPADWIPVVQTATGVNLAALSTVPDFTQACTNLGGTYHPADTPSQIANALIADSVLPFQTQVADLQSEVATLQGQIGTLQGQNTALTTAKAAADKTASDAVAARKTTESAYQKLLDRPLQLTLAAKRFAPQNGVVMVTGKVNNPVTISIQVTKKQAAALGLSSRVIATATRTIRSQGSVLVTLKPTKATAKALKAHRTTPATVLAVSGGAKDSASVTLTR